MEKLRVTLKQHTPLIHFQHAQEGATLRATEVKPKLDRFILSKLGNGEIAAGLKFASGKKWIIGKGALNYKLRISVDDTERDEFMIVSYLKRESRKAIEKEQIAVLSDTPYFAQEDKTKEIVKKPQKWNNLEKKGIMHRSVFLIFSTRERYLLEEIKKHVQSFFIANNFGTRQSKGFGSFEVINITHINEKNETLYPLCTNEELLLDNFEFIYKKEITNCSNKLESIFSNINRDYKLLKSGITRPYAKSKLMLFGRSHNLIWDKKFLKINTDKQFVKVKDTQIRYCLQNSSNRSEYSSRGKENYSFLRALLGLAEQYEFLLRNPPEGDKKNKMIVKVKSLSGVDRFQSPILFKVLGNSIYLVGNEINPKILNKEFEFAVSIQKDPNNQNKPIRDTLFSPKSFSLVEFIKYAMNESELKYEQLKNTK